MYLGVSAGQSLDVGGVRLEGTEPRAAGAADVVAEPFSVGAGTGLGAVLLMMG